MVMYQIKIAICFTVYTVYKYVFVISVKLIQAIS